MLGKIVFPYIFKYHKGISETIKESEEETGLIVFGSTESDNNEIHNIVQQYDYNAEWDATEQVWRFPVNDGNVGKLRDELETEFELTGISANIEKY